MKGGPVLAAYWARFVFNGPEPEQADTLPLTVSLAALRALGVEVPHG